MNLIFCHGFLKNINTIFLLKCPKRMLEYYFSNIFTLFKCNTNNLAKLPNELNDRIHAEDTENSDKFMICSTTIPSTPNTLKNFTVNKSFHSSYLQREYKDKKETIINIFSEYVEPLLKYINHPALIHEWKLNIHAAEYEKTIDANLYKPCGGKINCHDSDKYRPTSIKDTIKWFLFSPLWNILHIL